MAIIDFRPATADDITGLVQCSVGLFAEDSGCRDHTMSQEWPHRYATAAFREDIDHPDRLVLVADDGTRAVGYLLGSLAGPSPIRPVTVATLVSMYVFPAHRRAGVGAALIARFRAWARKRAADRVCVTAYASNEDAIRFYRREGFGLHSITLEDAP